MDPLLRELGLSFAITEKLFSSHLASLCYPACALLQLPPFLSLLLLSAWVARCLTTLYNMSQHPGCLWEIRLSLCRSLQLKQLNISCMVYSCMVQKASTGAMTCTKHRAKWSGKFCPYLVKRAWTHVELMSSTGCIANTDNHLPSFI